MARRCPLPGSAPPLERQFSSFFFSFFFCGIPSDYFEVKSSKVLFLSFIYTKILLGLPPGVYYSFVDVPTRYFCPIINQSSHIFVGLYSKIQGRNERMLPLSIPLSDAFFVSFGKLQCPPLLLSSYGLCYFCLPDQRRFTAPVLFCEWPPLQQQLSTSAHFCFTGEKR